MAIITEASTGRALGKAGRDQDLARPAIYQARQLLLRGFFKESQRTPPADLKTAKQRLTDLEER